jgi:hypothetical protein
MDSPVPNLEADQRASLSDLVQMLNCGDHRPERGARLIGEARTARKATYDPSLETDERESTNVLD